VLVDTPESGFPTMVEPQISMLAAQFSRDTVSRTTSQAEQDTQLEKLAERRAGRARLRGLEKEGHYPSLCSGEEALKEVAKPGGVWDWALVGPMPEQLPLAGGGYKGVEELKLAVERRTHSFGLLRMTFSCVDRELTKLIQLQTAEESTAAIDMDRSLSAHAPVAVRLYVGCQEDCNAERFIEALHQAATSDEERSLLTMSCYMDDCTRSGAESGDSSKLSKQLSLNLTSNWSDTAKHETGSVVQASRSVQRKRVKGYTPGDRVEVLSNRHGKWMDGEVLEVVTESCIKDGIKVRAGSTKVLFNDGAHFKWMSPVQFEDLVRPSSKPRFPASLTSNLVMEVHTISGSWWVRTYGELNRGFFQWWHSQEEAEAGGPPVDCVNLLGLRQCLEGRTLRLQVDGAAGSVYACKVVDEYDVASWVEALWTHAEYCQEEFEVSNAERTCNGSNADYLHMVGYGSKATHKFLMTMA